MTERSRRVNRPYLRRGPKPVLTEPRHLHANIEAAQLAFVEEYGKGDRSVGTRLLFSFAMAHEGDLEIWLKSRKEGDK